MRERGLKFLDICYPPWPDGRSREGAWIEIGRSSYIQHELWVAPVRERGLKSEQCPKRHTYRRRSREGAWIEIYRQLSGKSLEYVAPVRERGLKSAGEQQSTVIPASLP